MRHLGMVYHSYTLQKKVSEDALIDFSANAQIWYNQGNTIAVTINDKHYAFFAPEGSHWQLEDVASQNMAGKVSSYFGWKKLFLNGRFA